MYPDVFKKGAIAVVLAVLIMSLSGCGPKDDDTNADILSSYGVDVTLPFATRETQEPLPVATAKVTEVVGWNGETLRLTEGEYASLSLGNIGSKVKNLQNRLIELGYMEGTASGTYDQATALAVKLFQTAYQQETTGIADEILQTYLFDGSAASYNGQTLATATPTQTTYRSLQKGDSGSDVKSLQKRLFELGYMNVITGSYFDTGTENAVKAVEAAYGTSETGIATVAFQEFLYSDLVKTAKEIAASATPTPAASTVELAIGSRGSAVKKLQKRLAELGYLSSGADGVYGENTAEAVMLFEEVYCLTQDGIADALVQELLYSDDALSYENTLSFDTAEDNGELYTESTTYEELSLGDRGTEVAKLQKRLIELGYLSGTADGVFGTGTEEAVEAFEKAYNRTPTGIATTLLQSYLYSDGARKNSTASVAVSYSKLEYGDSGDTVTNLQRRLKTLGYMTAKASGTYDEATRAAVKDFQKALGLTQTGIATATLQKEIYSTDAPAKSSETDKVVTVNKAATVRVSKAEVYTNYTDYETLGTVKQGTSLMVLRTRGDWAEVQNAAGDIGYMLLSDLSYTEEETVTAETFMVQALAYVSEDYADFYETASASAEKLGRLSYGSYVTWLRSRGDWAEVENSKGQIGYCKKKLLTLVGEASDTYSYLAPGSTGTGVSNLQKTLKNLGYYSGNVDGKYLTKTAQAVKLLQKQLGLSQDGNATVGLQDILNSNLAPKYSADASEAGAYTDMYYGRSDEEVSTFQLELISLGFLSADDVEFGTYDLATCEAVIAVQQKAAMQSCDGMATAELQAALHNYSINR